jgi:hypothetical protein
MSKAIRRLIVSFGLRIVVGSMPYPYDNRARPLIEAIRDYAYEELHHDRQDR